MRHPVAILTLSFFLGTIMCLWLPAQQPGQTARIEADSASSGAPVLVASPTAASSALMKAKLGRSQKVLEGLLRKDFDQIASGAREMKRISEAAEWPRARDNVYEHFSAEFRRQCSQLESLASRRNHEGVTFVYLQMTTTCIQCHDHVRDSLRVAGIEPRDNVSLIPSQWPQSNDKSVESGPEQVRRVPVHSSSADLPSSSVRPAASPR
ncbi:hypothetical protein [Planctomycetes bacterium K23_9]|uniref:Cytochrome C n=1 Tax=Stieleria marina TaxID=1930275 RepID=A0A517NR02_9BACT|nr:hypothetical protein K239x_14930 [Planctomycetes bacterium K23_9]